jgi:hypothetical protein
MKKIIIQGSTTHRACCSECATVFSYETEDVHTNYVRGGEWVSCPHCGHAVRHFGAARAAHGRRMSAPWRGGGDAGSAWHARRCET